MAFANPQRQGRYRAYNTVIWDMYAILAKVAIMPSTICLYQYALGKLTQYMQKYPGSKPLDSRRVRITSQYKQKELHSFHVPRLPRLICAQ